MRAHIAHTCGMRCYLIVVCLCAAACNQANRQMSAVGNADIDVVDIDTSDASDDAPIRDGWSRTDEPTRQALTAALGRAHDDSDHPGIAMAVAYADQRLLWTGAVGHARLEEPQLWAATRRFRIGSVSKTFTAAAVLQLIHEETVDLDDPLERWVAGFYDGRGITIRHLLTNTSGIPSYNYVGSFDDTQVWTPEELVSWSVTHGDGLAFEPGTQWEYSNTNWILLGLVIENATGNTYDAVLDERFFGPLGLHDTYVASDNDDPEVVDCYDERGVDITGQAHPSFGWAAGGIVSTPSDLAVWAASLYGGDVLNPTMLQWMTTQTNLPDGTVVDYGMGAFVERDGSDALFGHSGGIGGYLTYMFYWAPSRIALVVMVNQMEAELRHLAGYGWSVPLEFLHP